MRVWPGEVALNALSVGSAAVSRCLRLGAALPRAGFCAIVIAAKFLRGFAVLADEAGAAGLWAEGWWPSTEAGINY